MNNIKELNLSNNYLDNYDFIKILEFKKFDKLISINLN